MAQFDFYQQRGVPGYWLDCQAELLSGIATRLVVPLVPRDTAPKPVRQLNPIFDIGDEQFAMLTQQAGPIPVEELRLPAGSLAKFRYEIINAFDFLITGV